MIYEKKTAKKVNSLIVFYYTHSTVLSQYGYLFFFNRSKIPVCARYQAFTAEKRAPVKESSLTIHENAVSQAKTRTVKVPRMSPVYENVLCCFMYLPQSGTHLPPDKSPRSTRDK